MDNSSLFSLPGIRVQDVNAPELSSSGVRLSVLRLDQIHPLVSGNKWFKLKYNFLRAAEQGQSTLLSFGGPWSNHLHALACAGRECGFRTIGVVRGEIPRPLNPCLQDAEKAGMTLVGVSRKQYRDKTDKVFLESLEKCFGRFYLIPEGGANREGAVGCGEISGLYDESRYNCIAMACGTGTMLAGLAGTSRVPLLGFQVLKGEGYLTRQVQDAIKHFDISPVCDWSINDRFHCGGYAKTSTDLMHFIENFHAFNSIPLEPVYSGKLLYGLYFLIKRDFFPQNSSILAIHGGGLQGRRGFK